MSLPRQQHINTLTLLLLTVVAYGQDLPIKNGQIRLVDGVQWRTSTPLNVEEAEETLSAIKQLEEEDQDNGSAYFQNLSHKMFWANCSSIDHWRETSLTKMASREELQTIQYIGFLRKEIHPIVLQEQIAPPHI